MALVGRGAVGMHGATTPAETAVVTVGAASNIMLTFWRMYRTMLQCRNILP